MRGHGTLGPSFLTATAFPRLYPLSLHGALPLSLLLPRSGLLSWPACVPPPLERLPEPVQPRLPQPPVAREPVVQLAEALDRKSTRLNSSHVKISYAVFCLKKNKQER